MSVSYGKGAKAKATRLHSLIVRARGHCERCGQTDYSKLQAAHIIRRTYSATRTDTGAAWALCFKCHQKVDTDAWEFMELVRATCGEDFYQGLRQRAQAGVGKKTDWEAEAERLKTIWSAIQEAA